jgi:hypothetical protein
MLVEYFERYGLQAEEAQDMFSTTTRGTTMRGTIGGILEIC